MTSAAQCSPDRRPRVLGFTKFIADVDVTIEDCPDIKFGTSPPQPHNLHSLSSGQALHPLTPLTIASNPVLLALQYLHGMTTAEQTQR